MFRHGAPNMFRRMLHRTAAAASHRSATVLGLTRSTRNSLAARSFASEFLSGTNNAYLEGMYDAWKEDPSSVHKSWDVYFRTGQSAHIPNSNSGVVTNVDVVASGGNGSAHTGTDVRVLSLIRAYRSRGHEVAKLNPLAPPPADVADLLNIENFGFSEAELSMPINVAAAGLVEDANLISRADANDDGTTSLEELVNFLKRIYTGEASYEISHINEPEKSRWLKERVERVPDPIAKGDASKMLAHLAASDGFESFLAKKFNTAKRFGVEGLETLIPGLNAMIGQAASSGVNNVVLGMAHRGRLNVLTNVMQKPYELVFKEFEGHLNSPSDWTGTGDVKYHLGTSGTYVHSDGHEVHLTLLPNPSHLEAVNTVVLGKTKAKMDAYDDVRGDAAMPVLLHGDAAMAGQGIVYETMQLARLQHYSTGGTLHVVTNNQVGFTTNPEDSRSTLHPSDIAKAFKAPVFHVNADNIFEVCRIFRLATEYRMEFHTDVVINLLGYRRLGHNELDNPSFTQPTLYNIIAKHPKVMDLTVQRLTENGMFTQDELDGIIGETQSTITKAYDNSSDFESPADLWMAGKWANIVGPAGHPEKHTTGVDETTLEKVASAISTMPDDMTLTTQLGKILKLRAKRLEEKANMDWGTVEALAFGTLLMEDKNVRLSGQDAQRGTFSHRHAVLHDLATDAQFCPLQQLAKKPSSFTVANSPLSEFGVLGFELGYSMEDPERLTIWEAQFGDFTNGAQIILDQFLSAMENKWYRQSGLVLLLPHGYQGQGPEHSSCRIERFLQCADEDPNEVVDPDVQLQTCNWQVANPTTPANYFHLLRRQNHRNFRKPLIVASTKSLLRHKEAVSSFDDLTGDTRFLRVLPEAHPDDLVEDDKVERVVLCSGQIYYQLLDARRKQSQDKVAIVRVEQLSPFPSDLVAEQLARYPKASCAWVQEEPQNMGAWTHAAPRIVTAAKKLNGTTVVPDYIGRTTMASTAEGTAYAHAKNQADILERALTL